MNPEMDSLAETVFVTISKQKQIVFLSITETDGLLLLGTTGEAPSMTDDEKTSRTNIEAENEIFRLEELETPQRLAEALPDDSGGTADGRAWFKANRAKIAVERAKIT